MTRLLASGALVDWIIAGVVLEGLGLTLLYLARGRGVPPRMLLPNLGAGLCLLLALRLVLAGAWWFVCAALLGAFVLHLFDLRERWHEKR